MSAAEYQAHLATGSTTRALCWRLERADGTVFGFTDHDEPLSFGGLTYEARAALAGSEVSASLGLAVDDQDVAGALASDRITPRDLIRGLYDGARVLVYDVNWRDVAARRLIGDFTIGEVERGEVEFRAELRSAVARLAAKAGGRFAPECSARLGDARCKVALGLPAVTGAGAVTALTGDGFRVSGLGAFAGGWFARGVLTWTSGANASAVSEVRAFTLAGGRALSLWRDPPAPVAVGDGFTVSAGCDKSFGTCRAKFGNGDNFRGFPHMPGEGFAAEYAVAGHAGLDGGPRHGLAG
ncbi:DUF2163 domain-containing protein [Amaricoccus solimangrovi]|uniref:DUF2163 domain-containing protein n=1 Tax=Amaricoccus solimangrovi TaxID=2589815 RepID=A0A501WT84_9RHOB|nr:DUF2163 domain-containing protein [Amaricoccus solimangrovi]TPE52588.1 DUF2163 domain-containing protein [Amaricoccus solimangrovi]